MKCVRVLMLHPVLLISFIPTRLFPLEHPFDSVRGVHLLVNELRQGLEELVGLVSLLTGHNLGRFHAQSDPSGDANCKEKKRKISKSLFLYNICNDVVL